MNIELFYILEILSTISEFEFGRNIKNSDKKNIYLLCTQASPSLQLYVVLYFQLCSLVLVLHAFILLVNSLIGQFSCVHQWNHALNLFLITVYFFLLIFAMCTNGQWRVEWMVELFLVLCVWFKKSDYTCYVQKMDVLFLSACFTLSSRNNRISHKN